MQLKDEKAKKNMALVIMILTLMLSIVGATFAYFMIAPTVNSSVNGIAARADMTLVINKISPSSDVWEASSKVMTPQLESELSTAMNNQCVDIYDNVTCQIYQMVLTNTGTAQVVVDGKISFVGVDEMPNLKWRIFSSDTILTATEAATNLSSVATNVVPTTLNAHDQPTALIADDLTLTIENTTGSVKYYYMILWIDSFLDENGNQGVQTDNGTYQVIVDFRSSNGIGVTSTFRS